MRLKQIWRKDPRHEKSAIVDLYLNLMTKVLCGMIHEDAPLPVFGAEKYDLSIRKMGLDWPSSAFTMIGLKRLRNVRKLMEAAIQGNIPGDFVEAGVWRGGASIMAKAVLQAYNIRDRRIVVCNSFQGLPPPDHDNYPADAQSRFHEYRHLAVSMKEVRRNFKKFSLLDNNVIFVKGWFKDTMTLVPSREIAVLRLDGDMYKSTIVPLEALFDRIPDGGWIIVDDYHSVPTARQAVHDFLDRRGLQVRLRQIDGQGVFFRKPS